MQPMTPKTGSVLLEHGLQQHSNLETVRYRACTVIRQELISWCIFAHIQTVTNCSHIPMCRFLPCQALELSYTRKNLHAN